MAIPFSSNDHLNENLMKTRAFKNAKEIMKKEYQHSKQSTMTGIGGRCTTKLVKNINSSTLELKKRDGTGYTTLREVVMSKNFEGKRLFMSMAVTPTEGNKEAVMTTFITRRSGDKEKSRRTAEAGEEYIRNQIGRASCRERVLDGV